MKDSEKLNLGEEQQRMKTYEVIIRATVTKVIRVEAKDWDDAYAEAHEQFCVADIEPEDDYDEETVSVEEVQP